MIIMTEHMKSDAMKQKEEELIMKKIALVNEKNEIIHRIDEKEEESVLYLLNILNCGMIFFCYNFNYLSLIF